MRITVTNPLRRGWSMRVGRVRLRSIPWYWDVLQEHLAEFVARRTPVAPRVVHHEHYCGECDRRWTHEGHTCAHPWVSVCAREGHWDLGPGRGRRRQWLIVVRRDRADLRQHLCESFEGDQRVSVVHDRRQSPRRLLQGPRSRLAIERRLWKDRREPDKDDSMWADLGFRTHQDRFS
jgi:hypothetical protein